MDELPAPRQWSPGDDAWWLCFSDERPVVFRIILVERSDGRWSILRGEPPTIPIGVDLRLCHPDERNLFETEKEARSAQRAK